MSQLRHDLSSTFTSSTAVNYAACRKPTSSPFYSSSFSALPSYSRPSHSLPSHSRISRSSRLALSLASSSPSLSTSYCTSFHCLCHSESYANNVRELHHTRCILVSLSSHSLPFHSLLSHSTPSHSPPSHLLLLCSLSSRSSRSALSPASSSPSSSAAYCTSFHYLCHSESYANNVTKLHHTRRILVSSPSHSPHSHLPLSHLPPSHSSCLIRHHTPRILLAIILVA
jgi:hypothetical protein